MAALTPKATVFRNESAKQLESESRQVAVTHGLMQCLNTASDCMV